LEPNWFKIYGEVARTGNPIRFKNGAKELGGRWFDLYAFRIGEPGSYKVAVIFRDITVHMAVEAEQDRLNQRLRDQHFYARSLIESNLDAIMMTDRFGVISDVNKQMELLTGCTRDELIGASAKNFFTDPTRAEESIKLVLGNKKLFNYELTVRARDGKETIVSYNAMTFYDRNRILQGVYAAARDITESKALKQELERVKALAENPRLAEASDGIG
jgi:PAS domain S-box-containing protein